MVLFSCAIMLVLIVCIAGYIMLNPPMRGTATSNGEGGASTMQTTSAENTSSSVDENAEYYAKISIKNVGVITVKLDQAAAPITTANFIELARNGFYNGLTFHRIIEGFMMQGGDPNGNGTGGSDKNIVGEFLANGYNNTLSHTKGAISMARSSAYNSASSQFFIVHEDSTFLDGQYAVFGYVTDGIELVDKVCEDAAPIDGNGTIRSADQPVISSIEIIEK